MIPWTKCDSHQKFVNSYTCSISHHVTTQTGSRRHHSFLWISKFGGRKPKQTSVESATWREIIPLRVSVLNVNKKEKLERAHHNRAGPFKSNLLEDCSSIRTVHTE